MTSDPGFHNPEGTPIYEDLVQEQGDVLADSRAAAEAALQESSAALARPAPHRYREGEGPVAATDGEAGETAYTA